MLLWVPGHCLIPGNEFADSAAKAALRSPLYLTNNINTNDILGYIRNSLIQQSNLWFKTSDWYREINRKKINIRDYLNFNTNKAISTQNYSKFIRLRLGHTLITKKHLMEPNSSDQCPYCNTSTISITHILSYCTKFSAMRYHIFQSNPLQYLSNPSPTNINIILKFLKTIKIYKDI